MVGLLNFFRFESLVYYSIDLVKPWNILIPGNDGSVRFHLVKKGTCFVHEHGSEKATEGKKGDLIFVLSPNDHGLRSQKKALNAKFEESFCFNNYVATRNKKKGEISSAVLCGQITPIDKISKEFLGNFPSILHLQTDKMTKLQKNLVECLLENDPDNPISEALLVRIVESVFISVLGPSLDQSNSSKLDAQVAEILKYVQKNYKSQIDWSAHIKKLKCSRPIFFRRFKALSGMTPNEYLNSIRMKKALALLEGTNTPIKALYSEVGFGSLASFSKKFKSFYGKSPSEVRKKATDKT